MAGRSFSHDLVTTLQKNLLRYMNENEGPYYAAFDADGTLWDNDLGEQFFQYQIDHCSLEPLQNRDPWEYYHQTKKVDPRKAYLWLAQVCAGHSIDKVREWAAEAVERNSLSAFQAQIDLIKWLKGNGITPYIVTASVQWAVEPAAKVMGIQRENVVGIQTEIDAQGKVTEKQAGPITWREGKVEGFLHRSQQIPAIFCVGNTYGDTALLQSAKCERLAVQTQVEENDLFIEEDSLRKDALGKGWLTHHFNQAPNP